MPENIQDNSQNSRRNFLKTSGLGVLGAYLASRVFGRDAAQAAEPAKKLEMVSPKDPMAQSLGYVEDAKKVDTKKFAKRAGPGGEKQFCYNCQFYQEKKNAKASKAAACTIFGGKGVAAMGWCNSWVQDPTVKD